MSFSKNLGLFMAFYSRKIKCKKLAKFKANPLQKWPFLVNFRRTKKVSKCLNSLRRELIDGQPSLAKGLRRLRSKGRILFSAV